MSKMVKEIPLTQGKIALVDDEDYERIIQYKWSANKIGNTWYAVSRESTTHKTILMHRLILSTQPHELCDHINGNGLDNRRCNLRLASKSQNAMNQTKTHGTSTYKGVTWNKRANKWTVQIMFNYKNIYMGDFRDEREAAIAYDEKAIELFGEYAKLNFGEIKDTPSTAIMVRRKRE